MPNRPAPRRHITVHLDAGELAAFVAHYTLDPTCPGCGGPAQLNPGKTGIALDIEHLAPCPLLRERP